MSRYIDAEWLEKLFPDTGEGEWTYNATALGYINSAPSIDIVRCRECRYWRAYETWSECVLWAGDPYETAKTNVDDFCSYGERKDDE